MDTDKVVCTSELLAGLENHSEKGAIQHARTSEDLVPWVLSTSRFSLQLLLDFTDLVIDERRVRINAVQACHVHARFIHTTLAVCITR